MGYRLSIVIPCYRVEPYLRRCLDALLAQSLDGLQLICINDGSPYNCLQILREYPIGSFRFVRSRGSCWR